VADWHGAHPVQSLILRTGLRKPHAALQQLERGHSNAMRFLEGSQRRLQDLEQAWSKKEPIYQQQLEQEGKAIQEARRNLQIAAEKPDTFSKYGSGKTKASVRNGTAIGIARVKDIPDPT
jgi:hypothetical protein